MNDKTIILDDLSVLLMTVGVILLAIFNPGFQETLFTSEYSFMLILFLLPALFLNITYIFFKKKDEESEKLMSIYVGVFSLVVGLSVAVYVMESKIWYIAVFGIFNLFYAYYIAMRKATKQLIWNRFKYDFKTTSTTILLFLLVFFSVNNLLLFHWAAVASIMLTYTVPIHTYIRKIFSNVSENINTFSKFE